MLFVHLVFHFTVNKDHHYLNKKFINIRFYLFIFLGKLLSNVHSISGISCLYLEVLITFAYHSLRPPWASADIKNLQIDPRRISVTWLNLEKRHKLALRSEYFHIYWHIKIVQNGQDKKEHSVTYFCRKLPYWHPFISGTPLFDLSVLK